MATVARETVDRAVGGWILDETDYGDPMVEHAHEGGTSVAYVLYGRNGGSFAQCAQCGARLELRNGDGQPLQSS